MSKAHPDHKKALASLRKVSRLEAKVLALQAQIAALESEQFLYNAEAFDSALRTFNAEQEQAVPCFIEGNEPMELPNRFTLPRD